jgi:predicted nucleic acid-binding protein
LKVSDALLGISNVFLDTSPVIYYIEGDQRYLDVVRSVFALIDAGALEATTSAVTLAECMVVPYRKNQVNLQLEFIRRRVGGRNTTFVEIDQQVAQHAAELRARHNIGLLDALQFGVALSAKCDAFVTNDAILKRVTEIKVVLIDDLEL